MDKWLFNTDFYTILAEKDGDLILDEIIQHFDENNSDPSTKTLIIDQESLEHDFKELRKYQNRLDHYYHLGYNILITD